MSLISEALDLVRSRLDCVKYRDLWGCDADGIPLQANKLYSGVCADYKEDVEYRGYFALHLSDLYVVRRKAAHAPDSEAEKVFKIYRLIREEYPLAIPNYNGSPCAPIKKEDQMLFGLFEEPESQWQDIVATDSDGNWIGCEPHL